MDCIRDMKLLLVEIPRLRELYQPLDEGLENLKDEGVLPLARQVFKAYKELMTMAEENSESDLEYPIMAEEQIYEHWTDGYRKPDDKPSYVGTEMHENVGIKFKGYVQTLEERKASYKQKIRSALADLASTEAEKLAAARQIMARFDLSKKDGNESNKQEEFLQQARAEVCKEPLLEDDGRIDVAKQRKSLRFRKESFIDSSELMKVGFRLK